MMTAIIILKCITILTVLVFITGFVLSAFFDKECGEDIAKYAICAAGLCLVAALILALIKLISFFF